eukprot:2012807-Amphidinium_carterae.1
MPRTNKSKLCALNSIVSGMRAVFAWWAGGVGILVEHASFECVSPQRSMLACREVGVPTDCSNTV